MSISIKYEGRTFNNVFQYVFARLVAERNGLRVMTKWNHPEIININEAHGGVIVPDPDTISWFNCECLSSLMKSAYGKKTKLPRDIAIRLAEQGQVKITDELSLITDLHHSPKDADWLMPGRYADKALIIRGYFQYPELYDDNAAFVKSLFQLEPIRPGHENDVVLHFRLDDYNIQPCKPVIHPSWYKAILDKIDLKRKRIYGIVERPKADWENEYLGIIRAFIPGIIIEYRDARSDWNLIRQFGTILCSNSSFCWWAAWLSNAQRVYTFDRWLAGSPQVSLAYTKGWAPVPGKYLFENGETK